MSNSQLISQKQLEYRQNANKTWNVKSGATRSGKTYGDYLLIPKRLLNVAGKEGINVILGSTKGTITRNVISPMQKIYGKSLVGDIKADQTVTLFNQTCYCIGASNIRQANALRGSSIKYCYGDEVTTWNYEVFQMLLSRLDKPYSRFDGTCNPQSNTHWFKQFLDTHAKDVYHQSYTIFDNPFNDENVVSRMQRDYKGTVYYDRYILGKWVAPQGVVYPQFANNPSSFTVDKTFLQKNKLMFATIGVDFGGNKSAHAFSCTGYLENMQGLVTLKEWYYKGELTPSELENQFVAFCLECKRITTCLCAYADCAETTLIQGLRNACRVNGVAIDIQKSKKEKINQRIRFLCSMMAKKRYFIMDSCHHTINALSSALWDETSLQDSRLDNGYLNIDSLDAMEYSFENYMSQLNLLST